MTERTEQPIEKFSEVALKFQIFVLIFGSLNQQKKL